MASSTQIEWTDATWNPVTGCTKITRGCDFCYAERFSERFRGVPGHPFESGFDLKLRPERLTQPLRWRRPRRIFSENNRQIYARLATAIAPFHKPEQDFEIKTYCGEFEDAVSEIQAFIGRSFPLIFIDPTGWTGYSFKRIKPLFDRPKCEVLINFMYDFVNRAASMSDAKTISSLDPILGGPEWETRLDANISRGRAVEKLFRDNLRQAGNFDFVVSTKIDRSTADRPHFFIVYGTKSRDGLKTFREIEYDALKVNARDRADAKERKREHKLGSSDLFSGLEADIQEATIDDLVKEQKSLAGDTILKTLHELGPTHFSNVWVMLLQAYMLRVTNVKDICVDLVKIGKIENTWGGGNRKPRDGDRITLKPS